jgi:hypothetical protein
MLNMALTFTSILGVFTGLTFMALGDWSKLTLKFGAVALSTASAIFMAFLHLTNTNPPICSNTALCSEYMVYGIIRNIAFILFHIAFGRDAILLKKCERQCYRK